MVLANGVHPLPRIILTWLLVFGAVLTALAADPKPLPKGLPTGPQPAPPRFATIASLDKKAGALVLAEFIDKSIPYTVTEERTQDGKKVAATTTLYKTAFKTEERKYDLKTCRVYDGKGHLIKPVELWPRLQVGAVVLVSSDGKKVHSTYRHNLKKEVLIFVELAKPVEPVK